MKGCRNVEVMGINGETESFHCPDTLTEHIRAAAREVVTKADHLNPAYVAWVERQLRKAG